jgi:MFS family permease
LRWGACLGIALTSGPIIGGWITNFFGWRWVFFPACVALIIATFAVIPESRDRAVKRLDFIGILLMGVAGLGAVLSNIARNSFLVAASAIGLNSDASEVAAKRVISGDLAGMLSSVPENVRDRIHSVALSSFADGFAAASLLAAVAALVASVLTWRFVGAEKPRALRTVVKKERPCMVVDCRHPI